MKKLTLTLILICHLYCKTLNDAQENKDIKKCKVNLLYTLYKSQEVSSQVQSLPLIVTYSECLEIAKLKRGQYEIPL
jgi:hypothetical protein